MSAPDSPGDAPSAPSPSGAPSHRGRVCVVTGASNGLGKAAAHALAREGFHLFLACRSRAKTLPVVEEIRKASGNAQVEFLELDLASLASVRRCAETFLARGLPLHLLVNNAGVANTGVTEDGFESQFGVNHLGHFLLTNLLLDRLKASGGSGGVNAARIVILTSDMHYLVWSLDVHAPTLRQPRGWGRVTYGYAVSKLANLLFMAGLNERLAGTSSVVVHAVHPGLVATDIIQDKDPFTQWLVSFIAVQPDVVLSTILDPALKPEYGATSGLYFQGATPALPSKLARDPALIAALWRQSEVWTGLAPS